MPNTTQSQIEMTPEEAKASLGIATHLQDQLMPRQMQEMASGQEQTQEPQKQPQEQAQPQETPNNDIGGQLSAMELSLTKKLDEMRKEIKDDNLKEIEGIKNDLKSALNEDDTTEKT